MRPGAPTDRLHAAALSRLIPTLAALATALGTLALTFSALWLPAAHAGTRTVTSSADSGTGSLRQAIADAQDGDTILFDLAYPATIVLTSGPLQIAKSLTMRGPGAENLAISGSGASRVAWIADHAAVTLSGVTVCDGYVNDQGAGIHNRGTLIVDLCTIADNVSTSAGDNGAGIWNEGTLTVTASAFSGNRATGTSADGGAIMNKGTATIENSAFSGNRAAGSGGAVRNAGGATIAIRRCTFRENQATGTSADGGAVMNNGTATIENSTFSANSAIGSGGAVRNDAGATVTIRNCTLTGNRASGISAAVANTGGTMHLINTIVANSTAGADCQNTGTLATNIHNLIEDGTCNPALSGDPRLGPLADNGGDQTSSGQATWTHALLPGSLAIDAVPVASCLLRTDQRGTPRPNIPSYHSSGRCDIGAFEVQFGVLTPAPNAHTVPPASAVSIAYDEPVSPAWVTSRTFAVHAMQTGLLSGTHGVQGTTIVVTPVRAFKPGELVYATATTATLNVTGEQVLAPTVWQFRAAVSGGGGSFADSGQRLGAAATLDAALGDLDGDGDLDAFAANMGANQVWLNGGGGPGGAPGVFTDSLQRLGSAMSYGVALGDLDGDGDLDAFLGNGGGTSPANEVWLNQGGAQGGTPAAFLDSGQRLGISNTMGVALGDLDGDGDLDAFLANNGGGGTPGEPVTRTANEVWLNQDGAQGGTPATFRRAQALGTGDSMAVALGDLDGDGDLDAFVANDSAQPNEVWLNDGRGRFADSGQRLGNAWSYDVALGDLDGDGDLDAFVADVDSPSTVWLNDGRGRFTKSAQHLGGPVGIGVALGDLDGDGDLDALIVHSGGQASEVWLNDGGIQGGTPGAFARAQSLEGADSMAVALGDLDGDGDLDAFVASGAVAPANQVWLNQASADLAIAQTVGPTPIDPGQTITLTLVVTNGGPYTATGVTVTDTLGSGLIGRPSGDNWSCSAPGEEVVCTRTGPLAAGQSGRLYIAVSAPANGTIANRAAVTAAETDLRPGDNAAYAYVAVRRTADLSIAKRGPGQVQVGEPLTYVLTVANAGPAAAGTVTSTQAMANAARVAIPRAGTAAPYPSTLTLWGAEGTIHDITVTLHGLSHPRPADLAVLLAGPGGQRTLLMAGAGGDVDANGVTVTLNDAGEPLPASGLLLSSVTYRPTRYGGDEDLPAPAPSGPYGSALSAFQGRSPNGTWQLYVYDRASPESGEIAVGWSLQIAIIAADAVTLIDALPAGLAGVSVSAPPGWSCTPGGPVTCETASLPPGASTALTVRATAPTTEGPIVNVATITSTVHDPDARDNRAQATTVVVPPDTYPIYLPVVLR